MPKIYRFVLLLAVCISFSCCVTVCPSFKDYFTARFNKNCFDNPDGEAQNPAELIRSHGYNSRTYQITTKDGYILTVERLHKDVKKKTPIIIGPGIYMNSMAFINRGNKSLAFFLANNGYQVWIINWRGTKFSREHISLSSKDREFWNTEFHEMAIYDLKSVMQEIMEETDRKGIYIGYSMGTTIGMVFNIKEKETAEKTLKGMIHLAPVTRMDHSKSILAFLNPFWPLVKPFFSKFKHGELKLFGKIGKHASNPLIIIIRELIIIPIFGNSWRFLDPLTYPVTAGQNRDSISIDTIEHYHQIIKTKSFKEMDFGSDQNMLVFKTVEPPSYDLKKLSLPQSMIVGGRDIVATKIDTTLLYQQLPETSKCGYDVVDQYGHKEFINSKDTDKVLFSKVLDTIEKIDSGECEKNHEKSSE